MPIRIIEPPDSRDFDSFERWIFKYIVKGTMDQDAVADALVNYTEPTIGGWTRLWSKLRIAPDPKGGGVWHCEVPYGLGDEPVLIPGSGGVGGGGGVSGGGSESGAPPGFSGMTPPDALSEDDPLGREWVLDFSSKTRKRYKSIKDFGGKAIFFNFDGSRTVLELEAVDEGDDPYVEGVGEAPIGSAIGYNEQTGEVSGCDVPDGTLRLELTLRLPYITLAYTKLLKRLQNHVNSEAFLSRPAGEVMFVSANEQGKAVGAVMVRYVFEFRDNVTDERIDELITIPFRRGWDVLDVKYKPTQDPDGPAGKMINMVSQAKVQQVVEYDDLNQLFFL